MEQALQELTNLGSEGVRIAVDGYTTWYLVHAIGWFAMGWLFMGVAIKIRNFKLTSDHGNKDLWNDALRFVVGGAVALLGIAMIIYNLSTIIAPKAYAIHALIMDLK